MQDHELLREYAERHSERAFAELVGRHIDLVYSAAYRVVGEEPLARDVTQMVFIGLARAPQSIRNPLALAGWLYRATRFTAASALRKEQRRRQWEHTAVEMNALESDSASVWQAVAPHLEAAMETLDAADQDAVALRFFQSKSLREVGEALGTSEDTAQKRVSRALEKLRGYFARQGVGASSVLLAAVLGTHATQAAPAGLAASVASAATAGAAGGTTTALGLKLIGTMTTTSMKITAVALLVIAAATTPVLLKKHRPPVQSAAVAAAAPEPDSAAPAPQDGSSPAASPASGPAKSVVERLIQAAHKLTPTEVEGYLRQNQRSAENLLAAFRETGDAAYLREAAANFPDDPAVDCAVITQKLFPQQQRLWLERFKTNAPENSLAPYLSALDYFKAKQTRPALQELADATGKPAFKSYAAQTSQAVEEMYNLAGRSSLEAKHASTCGTLLSHLPPLKDLATQVLQLTQQYRNGGDTASANSLTSIGLALAQRLSAPDNNQHVIDELVGLSIESKFLSQLNARTSYDFLGGTAGEALARNAEQRKAIRDALTFKQQLVPTLSETDLANYLDREKLYGEPQAMAWLQTKYGPAK